MNNTKKILIVEDEPIIAADLAFELEKLGYEVVQNVESGEEAIDLIKNNIPIHLILMDIQLEGHLDGIDTAHEILKSHKIPIVFLTSNTDEKYFARAKLTKPAAFLSKPFRISDLRNTIALTLENVSTSNDPPEDEVWFEDRLFVKTKDWLVRIKIEDLLWVEAEGCYCTLRTTDKSYTVVSTLKKFETVIQNKFLKRIHRSYMVNINAIDKISESHLAIGNKIIPIGRSYKIAVQKLFRKL